MVEVAAAYHCHCVTQNRYRPDQAASDEPRDEQPARECQARDREQHTTFIVYNLLHPRECRLDAELTRAAIDLPIERGERRLEAPLQLELCSLVGQLVMAGVVETEDAVSRRLDLDLNRLDTLRELHLVRFELALPAVVPVIHYLARQAELVPRGAVHAREVTPDRFGLVEHGGFQLGIGPIATQAGAECFKGAPFLGVASDRLQADEQHWKDHERSTEEQLALKGHSGRITVGAAKLRGVAKTGKQSSHPPRLC